MAQVARARLNDEAPPAAQDWSASPRAVDPDVLHIASYNIHRCVGTDMRCDVERVATRHS